MALPVAPNSQMYESDQRINYKALYWDTPCTSIVLDPNSSDRYTAFSRGIEFGIFDIVADEFDPSNRNEIEAALKPVKDGDTLIASQTRSILGYEDVDGTPTYRTGTVPNIYQYWGSGAPAGGSMSKSSLLKFAGYVKEDTPPMTLIFGGQGTVHVYVTKAGGSPQLLDAGIVREPIPRASLTGVSKKVIENEWGYLLTPSYTFSKGDKVEIYYWHKGEPWGGVFCKTLATADVPTDASFLTALRDAPVLGTSFMGIEEGRIEAQQIQGVESAQLEVKKSTVTSIQIPVALSDEGEVEGYGYNPRTRALFDRKTSEDVIKIGRMIHFEAGYQRPDGSDDTYARFTGYIDDIYTRDGSAILECRGIDGLLTHIEDANLPDYIAYHAAGFVIREWATTPVWGIPAWDNWPLETLVRDLCYRAGIDAYNLGLHPYDNDPDHGKRRYKVFSTGNDYYGAPLMSARAMSDDTLLVTLERQPNYGNVAPIFNDNLPADDEYLFKPNITRRAYDIVSQVTDHYNYAFTFNAEGMAVLVGRSNPVYFQYFTKTGKYANVTDGQHQQVSPSAIGGLYFKRKHTDGAWTRTITGHFSRLDLYAGVGVDTDELNGGKIKIDTEVFRDGSWHLLPEASATIDTFAPHKEAFYYDDLVRADGSNGAVFTLFNLPFDRYRVTLSPAGPTQGDNCVYRLNGIAVYEHDPDYSPLRNADGTVKKISSLEGALNIEPVSAYSDMRNHVVVVGARKAVITDSDKVQDAEANPNNPEREFHVAVAVDPLSIYDPTSDNFAGGKRATIIFDNKVLDSDFARWLARMILHRYRMPPNTARIKHTALPVLEIGDPVFAEEAKYGGIDSTVWVEGYTENWSIDGATVDIEVSGHPELPAYTPREDIPVDELFDGNPIINLRVSYNNLYGRQVTNSLLAQEDEIEQFVSRDVSSRPSHAVKITNKDHIQLNAPVIPETLYLANDVTEEIRGTGRNHILKNHPYRHFWELDWSTAPPTLHFNFQEGDGTPGVYDKDYYGFPFGGGILDSNEWYALYDVLPTRNTDNPFYDPYTSEIGNFVRIRFDALVSGRYRVSIWDANRSSGKDTPIAWLTNPTEDGLEPERHWTYIQAGSDVEFSWDAVDNIGIWNRAQSADYAKLVEGSFGESPAAVGAGFYAWNDNTTNLHTLIGDTDLRNFSGSGEPYFTIGRYGKFLIKVEVLSPQLMVKDLASKGTLEPRVVQSDSLPNAPSWHPTDKVFIWTHLGEPTQVGITLEDYIGTEPWSPGLVTSAWSSPSSPDAEATIRSTKPVRMRFHPIARRGWMFQDDPTKISVQLNRQAHLKATIFDQILTLTGQTWDMGTKTDPRGVEEKRVTSRMYHNEDHTIEWTDGVWRRGSDLAEYEWIFSPTLFRKDFGTGQIEALEYGNYEQLEAVPGQTDRYTGAIGRTERAYLFLAYISYLFYLSAYVLDRSGRRQWGINRYVDGEGKVRGFIDKSKIVTGDWRNATDVPNSPTYRPEYIIDYERNGADTYLIRSVFVRQWVEPGWETGTYPGSPMSPSHPGTGGSLSFYEQRFVQPDISRFNLYDGDTYFESPAPITATEDKWLTAYTTNNTRVNSSIRRREGGSRATVDVPTTFVKPPGFGNWHFSRENMPPFFSPSPLRDFRPYWRYPTMPDWDVYHTNIYTAADSPGIPGAAAVDALCGVGGQFFEPMRDLASMENWQGLAYDDFIAGEHEAGRTGAEALRYYGATPEDSVEAWGERKKREFSEVSRVFNYIRQDQLDRFDQYRGVRSRAPYQDRSKAYATPYSGDQLRSAPIQPVAPSGLYLLNLGRYDYYRTNIIHDKIAGQFRYVDDRWLHSIGSFKEAFSIRFRHEYVWMNERYFPVSQQGAATYAYFQREFTGAHEWAGPFWWEIRRGWTVGRGTFYDAGAWTGWKDDVPSTEWTASPFLRWWEHDGTNAEYPLRSNVYKSGGYGGNVVWAPTGRDRKLAQHLDSHWFTFERTNIFDEAWSNKWMRLAVGPEVPQSVPIRINLTIPDKI